MLEQFDIHFNLKIALSRSCICQIVYLPCSFVFILISSISLKRALFSIWYYNRSAIFNDRIFNCCFLLFCFFVLLLFVQNNLLNEKERGRQIFVGQCVFFSLFISFSSYEISFNRSNTTIIHTHFRYVLVIRKMSKVNRQK